MNKILFISLALVFVSNLSAETNQLNGIWYGTVFKEDFRSYEFKPNGSVHTANKYGPQEIGSYKLAGKNIRIEFPKNTSRPGKPLIFNGQLIDGTIIAKVNFPDMSWEFKLSRSPRCEGMRKMCGGGVFCQNSGGSTYWRAARHGQTQAAAESLTEFQDFYSFFFCAVTNRYPSLYIPHIQFPFKEAALNINSKKIEMVHSKDFKVSKIFPLDEGHQITVVPYLRNIEKMDLNHYSIHKVWRQKNSEMEWVFDKVDGGWRMTGINYRAENSRYPWSRLKYCTKERMSNFQKVSSGQKEDFEEFVKRFYCALKSKNKKMYLQRINFPLPYISKHTEGEDRGVIKKNKFKAWQISTVDGGETPLVFHQKGKVGVGGFDSYATGTSQRWTFKLKGSRWYLTEADIGNY